MRIKPKEKEERRKNGLVLVKIRKISVPLHLAFYEGLW